jgi:hypothetical protein
MRIDDPRFLQQLARRFCGRPSRYLHGCRIVVVDYDSDVAGLEVHVTNGFNSVVAFGWSRNGACVIPAHTRHGFLADHFDDEALSVFVYRFLHRHQLIDLNGLSTRKGVA